MQPDAGQPSLPEQPPVPAPGAGRSQADLEPAPWWTTPVQSPLVPTADEAAATAVPGRPATPVSAPSAPAPSASALPAPGLPLAGTGAAAVGASAGVPRKPARNPADRRRVVTVLAWVAGGLLAVGVLVALFFFGQRLVGGPAPIAAPTESSAASADTTPTATPTPTPTAPATGPQPVGVHDWDALRGGECLQPYTSPWEEEFTVVDCATPHAAQLVYRGVFAGEPDAAFPGEAALAEQINALCSAPGVIDITAVGAIPDLQVQGSYPVTDEQWTSGQRDYYCFLSRASAEPLG